MAFLERFEHMTAVLVDAEACRRVAYENVEDAMSEGIDYIELRYSPWFMAESHGMDPAEVMEACADGVRAAERDTGVRVNIIGILSRTYGVEACMKELDAILAHRDHIVAVDLAGDEHRYPAHLFKEHFKRVRDAGLAGVRPCWRGGWPAERLVGNTGPGGNPNWPWFPCHRRSCTGRVPREARYWTGGMSDLEPAYQYGRKLCVTPDKATGGPGGEVLSEYR